MAPSDHRSLVQIAGEGGTSGSYFLTVTKIDGNKVFVHLVIIGRGSFEGDREGTLNGNALTIETKFNKLVLTIDGDKMQGSTVNLSSGVVTQDILLVRKK